MLLLLLICVSFYFRCSWEVDIYKHGKTKPKLAGCLDNTSSEKMWFFFPFFISVNLFLRKKVRLLHTLGAHDFCSNVVNFRLLLSILCLTEVKKTDLKLQCTIINHCSLKALNKTTHNRYMLHHTCATLSLLGTPGLN